MPRSMRPWHKPRATCPSSNPPLHQPPPQRLKEAIQKGQSLLEEHQKLIRLADHSEHGWGVVGEYTAGDLADDSDVEKKIEKAERAAETKAGKQRKKRGAASVRFRGSPSCFPAAVQSPVMGLLVMAGSFDQPRCQAVPPPARPVGPCHFCGEMGHLHLYCPARAIAVNRKWYPFQNDSVLGVDVGYNESIYKLAKCVNGVNARASDGCCKGISG